MSKLRVAILQGGPSPEREVSLRSGAMVLKNLDPTKYDAFCVDFSDVLGNPAAIAELKAQADFVFLALHGKWGEDGVAQGLLDVLGLPYNGPGVMASALAMNKIRSKAVYREVGIPQARSLDFTVASGAVGSAFNAAPTRDDGRFLPGLSPLWGDERDPVDEAELAALMAERLGWDVVVKGASQGSTIGTVLVSGADQFWEGLAEVRRFDAEVLVEERLDGVEVTAGVIGGHALTALPLVEIRPKGGAFFDYEAKYTPGATEEICPARVEPAIAARVQELALRAHRALGCWGISRSDFIVRDGEAYILETNTLPGLTEGSLIPIAARAAGIMLPELFDRLIEWGLERQVAANFNAAVYDA